MIINKNLGKNNSKLIAEKYVEWLNTGVSPADILVLTFDSSSKKIILKNILNLVKNKVLADLKITTFRGLIYNSVIDNWGILENRISNREVALSPMLGGLESSQYILNEIIKSFNVKGYNSKKSLLHQLFRRYSLIVNNNLSAEDVDKKSKILKESFGDDAKQILQKFLHKTLDLRSFDYVRQAQIFTYIYKNTDYFKNIKYLIVEDADEQTPLFFSFLKSISENLKDELILIDKDGGSRIGYLCADINSVEKVENIFNERILCEEDEQVFIADLEKNVINNDKNSLKNLKLYSLSKRADMVDRALETINDLINKGVCPNEISVVTPVQDKMLKYLLSSGLKKSKPLFISGSEKLKDNFLVKMVIVLLKLSQNVPVDEYELRIVFSKCLGIPVKNCKNIFEHYEKEKEIIPLELGIYTETYRKFCDFLNELKTQDISLSQKSYIIYKNFIKKVEKSDLIKFEFFIKEIQALEKVVKTFGEDSAQKIITQLENSIISENPYTTLEINSNEIVVATPQKIIDNKIKTIYQIWLDVSSLEWAKDDFGPLYNAWVFSDSWDKESYTIEDNIRLSKEKIFRILRKLMLLSDRIYAFSSLFDTQGVENYGGIEPYLISELSEQSDKKKVEYKIIPRDDQKPVLEYKSGTMAISAVPGAGKTTILLALIVKLLAKGTNPENIFVLTYMESAARNFKDRIKNLSEDSRLPNISTIHGLALRILKENGNYERIGLEDDFEICDDIQRGNIIKSISSNIKKQDLEDFDRAISVLKLSGCDLDFNSNCKLKQLLSLSKGTYEDMKLSRFLKFFYNYQAKLSQEGLIDYDDILTLSVKLLEQNEDILEYYQNICEYIIEDEAQDSSYIQQQLIQLLSKKHNNLIRCGDVNQAITTTFTNADVEGFKNFINDSNSVNMDCSQRCSEDVWKLANKLVKYGNSKLKSAFYEIYMKPVEGKNPSEKNGICPSIYENPLVEKIETVKKIKSLLEKNPNSTIGVLLRYNYQINSWVQYINNSGLSAITRNECLGNKRIFRVIFSILKLISMPFDNVIVAEAYRALSECGILKPHLDKIIENYETDFISLDNDEILDADLSKFHWDMNYWLSFPELEIDELAIMIGLNYFSESVDKSNIYLISTLCAKLNNSTFNQTVQKLETLSVKPSLSGFKFFSEEDEENLTKGKIQVMTLHKSKGDEFDYVFIPELSEDKLSLDIEKLKLKKSSYFMEDVRSLSESHVSKKDTELKEFLIRENYRLLYVGITRAKKKLFISVPLKEKRYGKEVNIEPNIIFNLINE